ncbi:MAG TPA: CinA family nicotinamide mononucleotide deamidase-related protein [Chthoniobacterales bacterium]|nr:CinA family nicotinamide mononucleotide deamidase-related protein [Chthoniobacterales bacterium]
MRVVVINTGTELLLGDVLNSHLSLIAREIFPLGLRIDRQITVPDGEAIRKAIEESLGAAEIIFITGGLGPTTDDITREITADLFGLKLEHDPAILSAIQERAARRGFRLTDRVARQADVPEGATVLPNEHGSAPGLYLPANGELKRPHLFLLPGPPRELHPMFRGSVLSLLGKIVPPENAAVERQVLRIAGMGESLVEEAVGEQLLKLPGLELGYCARPGEMDLRLIGPPSVIAQARQIVTEKLGPSIFSTDGSNLETVVVKMLTEQNRTLALVESCTGGYLAHRLTNVPGASAVLLAGYVTYSNEAKTGAVGVNPALIAEHGAVSRQVATAMAEGARKKSSADFALATTGIAGPSGGSDEKPVGTVFIALAAPDQPTKIQKRFFPDDRPTFKELTAQAALEMLRRALIAS